MNPVIYNIGNFSFTVSELILVIVIVTLYGIIGEIINRAHNLYYEKRTYILWVPIVRDYIIFKIVFNDIIATILFFISLYIMLFTNMRIFLCFQGTVMCATIAIAISYFSNLHHKKKLKEKI